MVATLRFFLRNRCHLSVRLPCLFLLFKRARVPSCDTLHSLIRDHRERTNTPLNVEVRLMMQITPDYEALSVIQVRSGFS